VINDEPASPAEHLAHILGLALTNNKFLAVIKRDKPSLAGDHTHFPNLLNVQEGIPMDSPERGILQSFFNRF
jgi:hypothetical protein